ncbi:YolD-like family protein [Paenibacillus massiliensis]|uniref:YolD-like family protein n=1 Tax=Paenibacillus massiliensis TaxID=225917 RepID=UPI00047064A9|nr:YolD-like family protein [Paenibacillus massiliensis]
MSKKLEGNGLFEGSRFILPEHAARIREQYIEETRRSKPIMDDQEVQLIEQALVNSYNRRVPVELQVFDPFDDIRVSGVVTVLNTGRRMAKILQGDNDYQWIEIDDILGAYVDIDS